LFVVRETPFLIQQLFLMRFPEAYIIDRFGNPSPVIVLARMRAKKENSAIF